MGGIQVNFCKTPGCVNFSVPPTLFSTGRGRGHKSQDGYKVSGDGGGNSAIICQHCKKSTRLKANWGVAEELLRQGRHVLMPSPIRCPDPDCAHHDPEPPLQARFHRHGETRDGSPRFRCRACGKTFSLKGPTHKQKRTHINASIFRHLINKVPLNRLMELEEVGPAVLYGKIDFIHRQCAAFAASREGRLPTMRFRHLNLSTDRQDYVINWGSRARRQTIQLTAVATADAESGYLFGLQCNFNPDVDPAWVEAESQRCGDRERPPQLRRFAHVWTLADYQASLARNQGGQGRPVVVGGRQGEVVDANGTAREDLETHEPIIIGQQLPANGVQIHADYLMHGHFQLLKMLLPGAEKIRFYMDSDAGHLSAVLGAFGDKVATNDVDIVQLIINKDMTIDERNRVLQDRGRWFQAQCKRFPLLTEAQTRFELMKEEVTGFRRAVPLPQRRETYLDFPLPDKAEPIKRVRFVTDTDHLTDDQMTWLMLRASLWPIDTVFNQIRRRVTIFERPIQSVKRARRMWYAYAPYNPVMVVQMLEIFRVWRNFVWRGKDGRSPAERLGLAAGEVRYDHILGFDMRNEVMRQFDDGK